MATSGAGTAVVILGRQHDDRQAGRDQRVDEPRARRTGAAAAPVKIRIASALTKPTITLRGTNRISFATPEQAQARSAERPARSTVAIR